MTEVNDPAIARKRRKAIIQSQRSEAEQQNQQQQAQQQPVSTSTPNTSDESAAVATDVKAVAGGKRKNDLSGEQLQKVSSIHSTEKNSDTASGTKKKSKKADGGGNKSDPDKKKTQIRYDPDVPMSKEQLAAWRREARRVRNRESAAASRQRIRNRITELEDEVSDWKNKYQEAMERLQVLERQAATGSS